MAILAQLKDVLDKNQIKYVAVRHSPAYTSGEVAHQMHVPRTQFAKSVLVKADGRYIVAVVEAADHIHLRRLANLLHEHKLRLADEHEVTELFPDCETGAMPPFGNRYWLPVVVDRALEEQSEIVFNAGTHEDAIQMKY
ncbi:MAG TPA: YbaK/EbsC family protein, partial [Bdellovibrionota bacterium]|nr:YbaK/EbsC family protein [Bdellovibrionota bacterium]